MTKSKALFLEIPVFILFISMILFAQKNFAPFERQSLKNLPPPQIQHFTFGFSEVTADSMWLRSIQDFDYCERKIAESQCVGQGWLYQMLNLISDLAPSFRAPLASGPLALTVIISDYAGASKLFDKAVERFPHDWPILYRAAYHAIYEEKNSEKAAELLRQAGKNGAPSWVFALAGRLFSEAGKKELGESIYREISHDPQMKAVAERLKKRLAEASRDSSALPR